MRPIDQAEAGDAEIYQLDLLLAGIVVAEGAQMGGVEALDEAVEKGPIHRACGRGDSHLHRLPAIAHVGFPHDPHSLGSDAVILKGCQRMLFQIGVERCHAGGIDRVLMHDSGHDMICAPIDGKKP